MARRSIKTERIISTISDCVVDSRKKELCKRSGSATIDLWMNLEDLLGTQEARVNSYASLALSNLPRTSITRWLHTTTH